ncbi:polyprenyl synthetase family protein [Niallia nealsonii]|uniref:polyprenyl synthetase family protein n=1 Tax=Niallia nealsonii TaxID=115979 RepID=UPI001F3DABA3|nr:farnesyl diphosphate synthase [Niallia nealsonii]
MQYSSLNDFTKTYKKLLEEQLKQSIDQLSAPSIIKDAMAYSLSAGGKRIRPLLLFATMHAFGEDPKKGILPATALEMIHTYSLIHDDLPSMDDDDLRRGIPTNHKVYGEAIAILAGDGLLTYSFQLLTKMQKEFNGETIVKAIEILSQAAGPEGMVGGQVADMEGEEKKLSQEELEYIHIHKTGKLLIASVLLGAVLSKGNQKQLQQLTNFAQHLGLAFQIRDDILDLEGDEELIGKRVGSDSYNHKSTYPALLTMDGAKKELDTHINKAKAILSELSLDTGILEAITDLVANRVS